MATFPQLPEALARFGLTVELVPGWETRSAGSFNPRGSITHHTAGPKTGDRPSLNICVNGRSDLPGPLCHVFLARSGVAVVVAAGGRANHGGPGGWKDITGNSSVFGTEAESSGAGDWTTAQLAAYPRIHAAFHSLPGMFGADYCCAHREWATPPGRKPDPTGIDMPSFRADVAALLANPGADDMNEEDHQRIVANMRTIIREEVDLAVWGIDQNFVQRRNAAGEVVNVPALQELADIGTALQRSNVTTAALVKLIGDSELNDLTVEDIEDAVNRVLDEREPRPPS